MLVRGQLPLIQHGFLLLFVLFIPSSQLVLSSYSSSLSTPNNPPPSIKSVQGRRSHMEDEVFYTSIAASHSGRLTFTSVFDGHGGGEVSKYLRSNYFSKFLQLLSPDEDWTSPERVKEAMREAVFKCDEEVGLITKWRHIGSTLNAVCVLGRSAVVCCNVGDSRAVLLYKSSSSSSMSSSEKHDVTPLSQDHSPVRRDERRRIEELGGQVVWHGLVSPVTRRPIPGKGCHRINGNLALSRSVGDYYERPFVICDPEMTVTALSSSSFSSSSSKLSEAESEEGLVVIGSDGLWDVFSSEELAAFIFSLPSDADMASLVVREALRRGSSDNISVIILKV